MILHFLYKTINKKQQDDLPGIFAYQVLRKSYKIFSFLRLVLLED
jgi:hypothetical protein